MSQAVSSPRDAAFKAALPAKGRAAGIHVSLSLVIFLVLLYLIAVEWYPPPFFAQDGGWQGIRLMFAVDVVLGPTLTFLVFNPAKPRREIVTDLSLIALVQLAALVWGVNTVYQQRPVALVESDGTFYSIVPRALEADHVPLSKLKEFDARAPAIVFQRQPVGSAEIREAFRKVKQGVQFTAQAAFYERFDRSLPAVFAHAAAFEGKAVATRAGLTARLRQMRELHGPDVAFLPFKARYGQMVLVVSRQGEIVDSFDF